MWLERGRYLLCKVLSWKSFRFTGRHLPAAIVAPKLVTSDPELQIGACRHLGCWPDWETGCCAASLRGKPIWLILEVRPVSQLCVRNTGMTPEKGCNNLSGLGALCQCQVGSRRHGSDGAEAPVRYQMGANTTLPTALPFPRPISNPDDCDGQIWPVQRHVVLLRTGRDARIYPP
jgi:hypothetical protein